jgi:hypothetical protein
LNVGSSAIIEMPPSTPIGMKLAEALRSDLRKPRLGRERRRIASAASSRTKMLEDT